ncbi:MAG: hypothetical protein JNN20_08265 [Betaproteobacteria bacterium]|nr:hypothetical protein [Betaproteobacteria bacterium]
MHQVANLKLSRALWRNAPAVAWAVLALAFACLHATDTRAAGQSSDNFRMLRDAINAGGGAISSANFRATTTLGEASAAMAMSSSGFRLQSGFFAQSGATAALTLLSAYSRKLHGAAGPFELELNLTAALAGAVTVEPRTMQVGNGHTVVFRFDTPITSVATVRATNAQSMELGTAQFSIAGNDVIVTLNGVPDSQRITVSLSGINGSGTASASMAFLVGDVDQSRAVTSADIAAIKARTGQTTNNSNFRYDLNTSGNIGAADVAAVKSRVGRNLP